MGIKEYIPTVYVIVNKISFTLNITFGFYYSDQGECKIKSQ